MKGQQGFTLVEMLVASVIMMAVLLIASTSYSFFHDRWFKDKGQFYQLVVEKKSQLMMLDVLNGTLPYLVRGRVKLLTFSKVMGGSLRP
ncbi:PilW family protein [Vibrio diabolicus]|uniref:PilW family protein n=1 Tax=Vibrio diabolicus TaxID=50719 RepID=UPI00374A2F93